MSLSVRTGILVLLFSLSLGNCFANGTDHPTTHHLPYKNQIRFTPFRLINLSNPGIELGYERFTSTRLSTQLSGYFATNFYPKASFNPQRSGWGLAIEQKYYTRKSAPNYPYVAIELEYLNSRNDARMHFMPDVNDPTSAYWETFEVHKQRTALNLLTGYQIVRGRISFTCIAGFGIMYRNVHHKGRSAPNDTPSSSANLVNVFFEANRPGKIWEVNVPLKLKLGFMF